MRTMLFVWIGLIAIGVDYRAGQGQDPTREIGRLFSPVGTLLQRNNRVREWRLPELFDPISEGDSLIALPGARADLQFKEGDLRLSLRGNLPELSGAPVLESSIHLSPGRKVDVDFTLLRGRVVLENHSGKGSVHARVQIWAGGNNHFFDVVLETPATAVALELHGRWPKGAPFLPKPGKGHGPSAQLNVLVMKGKARVEVDGNSYSASGPSMLEASIHPDQRVQGPLDLGKLPQWAVPGPMTAEGKAALAAVESLRKRMAADGLVLSPLAAMVRSEAADSRLRSVAVYSCAALQDLTSVLAGLTDRRSPEVRVAAVTALRHHSGDVQLYKELLEQGSPPAQAEVVLNLLRGFSDRDARRPETYDTLIRHLGHENPAIRELARWNLYLLVPQGNTIFYNAAGGHTHHAEAQAAWRKLIPAGQIPQSLK